MKKRILFLYWLIWFILLNWNIFEINDVDKLNINTLMSDQANVFMGNFMIIFLSAIPVFAVYFVYKIIKEFIN